MSDGEGCGGGEMRAGVGKEVSKYKITPVPSSSALERFFPSQEFLLLMTIVDSPLYGQSPIGLNFYDYDGLKAFIPSFFPLPVD
jgi:hypothetical protein